MVTHCQIVSLSYAENAVVSCTVHHLPVLEIGLLWCVSLSDACSEEVTLNKVEKNVNVQLTVYLEAKRGV